MRTNRIQEGDKQQIVERVQDHIVLPLGAVVNDNFRFTISTCAEFRKALDDTKMTPAARLQRARIMGEAADKELTALVKALNDILVQMQGLVKINDLINQIRIMEQRERDSYERIKKAKDILERKLLGEDDADLKDDEKPKDKDKPTDK